MKSFFYISSVFLLICACSTPRVLYDYDKKVNFESYKTYGFYPEIQTGLSELDNKRLFFQLDSVLQLAGYIKSQTPDFYINITSQEYQGVNNNSVGIGIGGTGRNVGVGISGGIPIGGPQINQEIIFDLIDAKNNELFWQASSTSPLRTNLTPLKKEAHFRKIVGKVFKKFPPKNGK